MPHPEPPLPLDPPAWLTRERATAVAMGWPAIALGVAMGAEIARNSPRPLVLLAWLVAGLGAQALGARWAARSRIHGGPFLRALAFQAAFLATALVLAAVTAGRDVREALVTGILLGGVTSFLPAIWQGIVGGAGLKEAAVRGRDVCERAVVRMFAWNAGIAGALALPFVLTGSGMGVFGPAWLLLGVAAPLAAVVWALARRRSRAAWLRSVEAGRVAGWRVVDEVRGARAGLLPVVGQAVYVGDGLRVRVLVRTRVAESPFRDVDTPEPVALVLSARE